MIKLDCLAGVGLVAEENFAHEHEAEAALELAFTQGSQGWGVRREVGVILRLARDLKIALVLAATADENGRMLKGAQMESGRIKKQRDGLQAQVDTQATMLEVGQDIIGKRDAEIGTLRAQLDQAYAQLALLRPTDEANPLG